MIVCEQMTFSAQGDRFTPSSVSAPFTKSHDPGVIGKRGRYIGVPIPYGMAEFDVPEEEKEKIRYLHRLVVPHLSAIKAAGADVLRIHISYGYADQCSLAFSRDEIQMLAEMDCDIPIDCWKGEPIQPVETTEAAARPPRLT